MPECDVCNSTDFFEEDGQFYCTVCNTQSQSMVVQETDFDSNRAGTGLRELRPEKKHKSNKQEYECGRPWSKYEAFQLILQAQADALIAHGAQASVKETILRLWAKYLSVMEVAFVGHTTQTRIIPKGLTGTKQSWHRELHRGGMNEPEVNPKALKMHVRRSEYHKELSRAKRQKLEQLEAKEHLAEAVEGETFYEGDNPLDERSAGESDQPDSDSEWLDSSSDSDTDQESSSSDASNEARSKTQRKCRQPTNKAAEKLRKDLEKLRSVEHMDLRKTLAFCYMGCLFASRWITVSDILRWVKDGSLPYLEATHHLHADMKLSAFDQMLLAPRPVTAYRLRFDAGRLLQFLGFEELPAFPIKYHAMSLTLALGLPEALVPVVAGVVRRCPMPAGYERAHNKHGPKVLANTAALSAAYLLLALKLLYGLDDRRERLLCEYTKEVQAKLGNEETLFDWGAWQTHATYKFLSATSSHQDYESMSVEQLCNTFHAANCKQQTYSHHKLYNKLRKKKVAAFQQENREMLKNSTRILLDRWRNRDANNDRTRAQQRASRAASDSTPGASDSTPPAANFRTNSLEHILNPVRFLLSRFSPGSGSSFSVSSEQISKTSTLDGFRESASSSPSVPVSSAEGGGEEESGEDAVRRLLELYAKAGDQFVVYPCVGRRRRWEGADSKHHRCYAWLLRLLSAQTFCPQREIATMVHHVQQSLLPDILSSIR